jgi:hypothetical protein
MSCEKAAPTTPRNARDGDGSARSPASVVKRPMQPLAATACGTNRWHAVSVVESMVNVTGGFSSKGESARTIRYQTEDAIHTYLEMDKNAQWFLKGVGGSKVRKGDLKAVTAMMLVRQLFAKQLGEDLDEEPAVADGEGSSAPVGGEVDPMDAMDELPEVVPVANKQHAKKKFNARISNRAIVQDLLVPARPACIAGCEDEHIIISVYRRPVSSGRSQSALYLRVSCVDWLLSYAADELHCQGVKASSPTPSPKKAGNCSAVADLYLEWDFNDKEWEASFVSGALLGMTTRMDLTALDIVTWNILKADDLVEGYLSKASAVQKKNALKDVVIMWAAAAAYNGGNGGDSKRAARWTQLMTAWASDDTNNSHGMAIRNEVRVKRRRLDVTAVADEEDCSDAADDDAAVAD